MASAAPRKPRPAHIQQGIERIEKPQAIWAFASEVSKGKDTQSGHWELAGFPVPFDWGYFPNTIPAFPKELTDRLIEQAKLPGILGNRHASGTDVIEEFGEEHISTGKPICYTSADSVFQICAHEESFRAGASLRGLPDLSKALRPAAHWPRHRSSVRRRAPR